MIYVLDKQNNRIVPCEETDFASNNILERQHLEKWIVDYPAILGEELLILTTEYDQFDKTKERLDILALDKEGSVVVIELKRDDSGKYVDLQAIKYAAYCSTLQLDDVIELYYSYHKKHEKNLSVDKTKEEILLFIDNDEFEGINEYPRIILVAKEFRPEVTASVLWLRKFEIDISCVKLSPYDLGNGEIAFESNIMIPLPEAKDFIIKSKNKERKTLSRSQQDYLEFFKDLGNRMKTRIPRNYSTPQPKSYYPIPTGIGGIHFEWGFHGRPRSSFAVELHFEKVRRDLNLEYLSRIEPILPELENLLQEKIIIEKDWGKEWSRFYVEKNEGKLTSELKDWAFEKMVIFINHLQPILDDLH